MSADKKSLSGKTGLTATERLDITVVPGTYQTGLDVQATRSRVFTGSTGVNNESGASLLTAAYSAGDVLTNGFFMNDIFRNSTATVVLQSVVVVDVESKNAPMDIFFFAVNDPADASTFAEDGDPATASDAQFSDLCVGVVSVVASDYKAFGGKTVACPVGQPQIVMQAKSDGTHLLALPVARGGVTFSSTNSLTFKFGFLQD